MKFYRDYKSIFKSTIYLIVGCGFVIPLFILYLIRPYFEITDGSGASIVIILFFCIMWIYAAYGLFKISLSLRDRNKITLEFNDVGIRYPYLLDDSIEILWRDITNIEYIIDQTNDNTIY